MNYSGFAIRTARLCNPGGKVGKSGDGESGRGGFQAISHQKIL